MARRGPEVKKEIEEVKGEYYLSQKKEKARK